MGQNRVFYNNIGLSDMHDFLLGIFNMHGSVPEPAVRTGTCSTSRDWTHRVFFVCIKGNYSETGMEEMGRTDHSSRFFYVRLLIDKTPLMTVVERSELSENSSSNSFPTQTTRKK